MKTLHLKQLQCSFCGGGKSEGFTPLLQKDKLVGNQPVPVHQVQVVQVQAVPLHRQATLYVKAGWKPTTKISEGGIPPIQICGGGAYIHNSPLSTPHTFHFSTFFQNFISTFFPKPQLVGNQPISHKAITAPKILGKNFWQKPKTRKPPHCHPH